MCLAQKISYYCALGNYDVLLLLGNSKLGFYLVKPREFD